MRSDRDLRLAATSTEDQVEAARAAVARAMRRKMLAYNASIAAGSSSIGVGVYLIAGLGPALIAAGVVVVTLAVFERLNGRTRRVLDRTSDS